MCRDKTAQGRGITSRVMRSERALAPRREVLTFPIMASGKDEPTPLLPTATMTRSDAELSEIVDLAGSRGLGQEVAVFPTRRKRPSSCRGWSRYCWMWVTLPGSLCAFSPRAFIWSQGIWILHVVPKGIGVLRCFQEPCTDENNMNVYGNEAVFTSVGMSMSHQNLNWQLIIDFICMQLLFKVVFRLSYSHDPFDILQLIWINQWTPSYFSLPSSCSSSAKQG